MSAVAAGQARRRAAARSPHRAVAEAPGHAGARHTRTRRKAPRAAYRAATALLLAAACASASATATCPESSATPVRCWGGQVASNLPTSGGVCSCTCGQSYGNAAPVSPDYVVSDLSECDGIATNTCATQFPAACSNVPFTRGGYTPWATFFSAPTLLQSTPVWPSTIPFTYCGIMVVPCPATDICKLLNGTLTVLFSGTATSCASWVTQIPNASYSFCTTEGCNSVAAAAAFAAALAGSSGAVATTASGAALALVAAAAAALVL